MDILEYQEFKEGMDMLWYILLFVILVALILELIEYLRSRDDETKGH